MPEPVSKKVTLNYPVTINGHTYPANVTLDLPPEVADDVKRISDNRLQQELKRMDGEQPSIQYIGHQG